MKARALSAFLAGLCLVATSTQSAIVYFSGPSFQITEITPQPLDVNGDGTPDVYLRLSLPFCYGSPEGPPGYCMWPYVLGSSGSAEFLKNDDYYAYAFAQPYGRWIGNSAPLGRHWSGPNGYAGLATQWWHRTGRIINDQLVYSGWDGPLGALGIGYLGVRFYAADALHYGWIRVRLPGAVVDWAYETCPDTPIRAGDIGSAGESVQFTVEWSSPRHRSGSSDQEVGTGSFILTGNTLRGELSLAGQFSSAHIVGPGNPRQRAEPMSAFGQPLVANAGRTAFFSEVILTPSQVKHLLRGQYCVTVDDGVLTGQIVPVSSAR